MHFLLLEKFEETVGAPQAEDLIELEAEGILTMKQIVTWFNNRRKGCKWFILDEIKFIWCRNGRTQE